MIFLGVDGGGTKTAFTLISRGGERIAHYETGTCYYPAIGLRAARELVQYGILEVCRRAGIAPGGIGFSFLGLPGYGEIAADLPQLNGFAAPLLAAERYRCGNDMICGWAAGLGCSDGINIVAGTGSIAYGERGGRGARCGGWGEAIGDEGSAHWLGRQALGLFAKMADGRLPKGPLYALLKETFTLENDLDLCARVYGEWRGERGKIAAVSALAAAAAERGDAAVQALFWQAGKELALHVDALRQTLGYRADEPVVVSWSGGVFNAGGLILDALSEALSRLSGGYALLPPRYPPHIGAAMYAARLNGTPLSDEALARLAAH